MADEVKLYGFEVSPFVGRVKMGLNLKGIKYQNYEEDLSNESANLLKYNPVYKKVPVLLHNRNPITEALVIVDYIDDVWKKGVPLILPLDPYKKATARFWVKFIDEQCIPALNKAFRNPIDARKQLQMLENELQCKGTNRFFGGDNIGLVDIVANFIAYWVGILEEISGIKIITKITEWADNIVNCQVVKDVLPPRESMFAHYKKQYGNS